MACFFYDLIYQKKYIDKIRLVDYDNLSKLIFHRKGVFDMIQPIKGVEKVNEVISGGNVIIGVSAPWCGYCRRLRPILEKISGMRFLPWRFAEKKGKFWKI